MISKIETRIDKSKLEREKLQAQLGVAPHRYQAKKSKYPKTKKWTKISYTPMKRPNFLFGGASKC
ncbi:hypothetical protein [Bacillus sp. R86525]|uniref:hypothetical protein n=1 Tax=Bacillus sp. R86525 TaxID=3101709 RepID=UPI0036704401